MRAPFSRRCTLAAIAIALASASSAAHAARAASPPAGRAAHQAALRARTERLFELREAARSDGSISQPRLISDLLALADSLEAAGLDSLAGRALYRAVGVGTRLLDRSGLEAHARRAIALSARARDVRFELLSTVMLAEQIGNRRPEESTRLLESRLARFRRSGDAAALGDAYSALARSQAQLGRWPRSLSYARLAVQTFARGGPRARLAYVLGQYSQSLTIAGRDREALAMADSAMRVARQVDPGLPLSRALVARSSALRAVGRTEESLADLRECVARDHARGDRSHEISTRVALAGRLIGSGREREGLAQVDSVERMGVGALEPSTAMRLLTFRAEALRGLTRHAELESLLTREVPRLERYGDAIESEESRASTGTFVARTWTSWMLSRLDRGDATGAFALEGRARARVFDRSIGAAEPSLAALQARLREQRAVLLALQGTTGQPGIVFLVTPDSVVARRFELDPVLDDARSSVAALASGRGGRALEGSLGRLSAALVEPLLARVPARTERIVTLPLAIATDLPIEALPLLPRTAPRLGERFAVHLAPSSAAWMALGARAVRAGDVVAFGDPALGDDAATRDLMRGPAGAALRRALPFARAEAREVAGTGGRVWVGAAATGQRLREEATRAAVLHVAAHGVLVPGDAARSGLVLAGADGLVSPAQVSALDVHADLVTLSACQGDRGPAFMGEGSLGLARAFLQAGSRSVLTTRWDVSDRGARALMAEFYRGLRAGLARDESLRRARIATASAGVPARDRLAFVLHGAAAEPVRALIAAGSGR